MAQQSSYATEKVLFDRQLLARFYRNSGFLDVQIVSSIAEIAPDKKSVSLHYHVHEGDRYYMDEVELNNEIKSIPEKRVYRILNDIKGYAFSQDYLDAAKESIVKELQNQGYVYAKVDMDIEKKESNSSRKGLKITCSVNPGKKLYINRINIHDNYKTRDKTIRDRLIMQEGEYYNQDKVKRSQLNLELMDIFKKVSFKSETVDEDSVDVNIHLEETGRVELHPNISANIGPARDDKDTLWKRFKRAFSLNISVTDINFLGYGQPAQLAINYSYIDFNATLGMNRQFFKHSSLGFKGFYSSRQLDPDLDDESKEESKNSGSTSNSNSNDQSSGDEARVKDYGYHTVNTSYGLEFNAQNQISPDFSHSISLLLSGGKRELGKKREAIDTSPFIEDSLGSYGKFRLSNSFTFRNYESYLIHQRRGFEASINGSFTWGSTDYFILSGNLFYTSPLYKRYLFFQSHVRGGHIFNVGSKHLYIDDQFRYASSFFLTGFDRMGPCDTSKAHNPLSATSFATWTNQIHFRPDFLDPIAFFYGFIDLGNAYGFSHDSKHSSLVYDLSSWRVSAGGGIVIQLPILPPIALTVSYPILQDKHDKITEPFLGPIKFGMYMP